MYNALHSNDGQLVAAVADMNIFEQMNESKVLKWTKRKEREREKKTKHILLLQVLELLQKDRPNLICFDGNITGDLMKSITKKCSDLGIPGWKEQRFYFYFIFY